MRFEEWENLSPQIVFVSATPGNYESEHAGQVVEQIVRPTGLVDPELEVRPARSQVDDVLSEIRRCVEVDERVLITVLTKRMAEDLTEYLLEQGVRVRYLHSDIDTVERVEIIRDLRLGAFDVLVGINLLREGLDMPEVSLVAIFDADKEGFLRSERSLIQTIGRAARNLQGRAILYAEKITDSMRRAMSETERRRELQRAFNQAHGIEPRSIRKQVSDIMEGAHLTKRGRGGGKQRKLAEPAAAYDSFDAEAVRSPHPAAEQIRKLETRMFEHAKNLEFEQAAQLRDRVSQLRRQFMLAGPDDNPDPLLQSEVVQAGSSG